MAHATLAAAFALAALLPPLALASADALAATSSTYVAHTSSDAATSSDLTARSVPVDTPAHGGRPGLHLDDHGHWCGHAAAAATRDALAAEAAPGSVAARKERARAAKRGAAGQRALQQAPPSRPLKIHWDFQLHPSTTKAEESYLRETLTPAAAAVLARSIRVRPCLQQQLGVVLPSMAIVTRWPQLPYPSSEHGRCNTLARAFIPNNNPNAPIRNVAETRGRSPCHSALHAPRSSPDRRACR